METAVVPPGEDTYLEQAWNLKEEIRRHSGVLKQRRRFFEDAYRRATVHVIHTEEGDRMVGFAASRKGGYLLFLAVHPKYQGEGFGRELVAGVAAEHDVVTCHARTSNEDALSFYEALGFETVRSIDNYYEDHGDAYFLQLGEDSTLRSRLAQLFTR